MADVATQFASDLGTNGLDVEGMLASLSNYRALAPARAATARHLQLIDNTRAFEASNAWKQVLVIYARARAAAQTNPDLATAIRAFEQFMKNGRRRKGGAPVAATPATPATATTAT